MFIIITLMIIRVSKHQLEEITYNEVVNKIYTIKF